MESDNFRIPTIRELSRGGSNGDAECGTYLLLEADSILGHRDRSGRHFCACRKNPKGARNLISVLAGLLVIFALNFNKAQCLFPSLLRN